MQPEFRDAKSRTIDHTVVGWRAWYTGGRRFNSTTTRWEDLPEHGVLYIIVYHRTRPYRRTMSSSSLYWIEDTPDGRIYAHDNHADAILPEGVKERRHLKYGKWVTDTEMERVREEVEAMRLIAPDESKRIDKWP